MSASHININDILMSTDATTYGRCRSTATWLELCGAASATTHRATTKSKPAGPAHGTK